MKRIRPFTAKELEVIRQGLQIWESAGVGGDVSAEDGERLGEACETAQAKVAALLQRRAARPERLGEERCGVCGGNPVLCDHPTQSGEVA